MSFTVVKNQNDSLYHYGIEGQKWGVRRYQNEDGSLTPAGRERYGIMRSQLGLDQNPNSLSKKQIKLQKKFAEKYKTQTRMYPEYKTSAEGIRKKIATKEQEYRTGRTVAGIIGGTLATGSLAVGSMIGILENEKAGMHLFDKSSRLVAGKEAVDKMLRNPEVYNTKLIQKQFRK